jgi:hypothetical protein
VARKIKDEFGDFSGFLTQLNADGGGFLFRHGWVADCLVGLLKTDPQKRLSVIQVRQEIPHPSFKKKYRSSKIPLLEL